MNSYLATQTAQATRLSLTPSAVQRALDQSPLADLPPAVLAGLVEVGRVVDVPAGDSLYRGPGRSLGVVVSGRLRMLLTAEDGRRAVLRYARPGTLLGVSSVFGWRTAEDSVEWEAMVDSTILLADADLVRSMAEREPSLGCHLADDLGRILAEIVGEFEVQMFGTVRRRVVHHLARMIADGGVPGDRIEVTQQELADAVGSVREVVARTLRELRAAGVVETGPTWIRVPDVGRLRAAGEPGG